MYSTRLKAPFLVGALAGLLAAGCGGGVSKTDCNDGNDNDGDGLIDDADPGCAESGGQNEWMDPEPPACANGEDDDGDGLIDFPADPGCADASGTSEVDPPPPPPECNDGLDNNSNGKIDYPWDSGCSSLEDEDEDDSPPITACSNGVDDDDDGLTDYPADLGCTAAFDDSEYNPIVGECGPGIDVQPFPASGEIEGDRAGAGPNELVGLCGGLGQEFVWTFEVTAPSALLVQTNHPETTLDTVVYVRSVCRNPDTELGCDDDDSPQRSSTLVIPRIEPGVYYIVVDSFNPGSLGHFKLTVEQRVAHHEPCDPAIPDVCAPGLICRLLTPDAAGTTCEYHECGDSLDNDGDGTTDYPWDAGCATIEDDTELINPGDPVPACGNGLDDDGDTLIDFDLDPGCDAASDNIEIDECAPGVEVDELPLGGVSGSTAAGSALFSGSCSYYSAEGPEEVYAFKLEQSLTALRFHTTSASFANALYVRVGECSDAADEIACSGWDWGMGSYDRTVEIAAPVIGTTYFVFVDASDYGAAGSFVLSVSGDIAAGEPCVVGDPAFDCTSGYVCSATTNTCVPSACNDGTDNDGDTLIDYPAEPGCLTPSDDDETDPPTAPVCWNGLDDDGDGFTDYPADTGCRFAADGNEIDECIPGVEALEIPGGTYSGTTSGTVSNFSTMTCGYDTSSYPEAVHVVSLASPLNQLTITATASFEVVLYVRHGVCATGTEVGCTSGSWLPTGQYQAAVSVTSPALGDYFPFVDSNWSTGAYTITVSGVIPQGGACIPGATDFTCVGGTICRTTTNLCEPTLCNDTLDNDGDLLADVFDPGCSSIVDDDETDPATPPACANGVDDDADTLIDYPADPGCARASDNLELDCDETDPMLDITHQQTTTGTTVGATHDFVPSCSSGSTAGEIVHQFTVPGALDVLSFDTSGSSYDTMLYAKYGGCDEADLACNDDTVGLTSAISMSLQPAGTYFVFVDGYSSSVGAYTLHVTGTVSNDQPCDPLQVVPGFLQCNTGRSCVDLADGNGYRCQVAP